VSTFLVHALFFVAAAAADPAIARFDALAEQQDVSGFLRECAKLDGKEAGLYQDCGDLQADTFLFDEAERSYAKVEALTPGTTGPLVGRARIAVTRGETKRAGELIRQALALDPQLQEAIDLRAEIERARRCSAIRPHPPRARPPTPSTRWSRRRAPVASSRRCASRSIPPSSPARTP
jgi:hypothetical protein